MKNIFFVLITLPILITGCASTPVRFISTLNRLGTLGGTWSEVWDINSSGHIVGFSETEDGSVRAFLYRDGAMIDLGTLGGENSMAYGINDDDEVVGSSQTEASGEEYHAFLWRDGTMIDLTPEYEWSSVATDINNNGWIIGGLSDWGCLWHSHTPDEYRRIADGRLRPLAINDNNEIVGLHWGDAQGFFWEYGTLTMLGMNVVAANGINSAGQIVGECLFDGVGIHACLIEDGSFIDLGVLDGHNESSALDINEHGRIVGRSGETDGVFPFLYDISDGVMEEVHNLGWGGIAHAADRDIVVTAIDADGSKQGVRVSQ